MFLFTVATVDVGCALLEGGAGSSPQNIFSRISSTLGILELATERDFFASSRNKLNMDSSRMIVRR